MAYLAIERHKQRGSEVIALLEMLGGVNAHNLYGDENYAYYTIDGDNEIKGGTYIFGDEYLLTFTLEKFFEKFPYKVGDKVYNIVHNENQTITKLAWQENEVIYQTNNNEYVYVNYLQSYKEEIMEKEKKYYDEWLLTDYLEFEDNDGAWADEVEVNLGKDYEIQIRGDKTFIVKKKSQYPKTYEECCKVLNLTKYPPALVQNKATYINQYNDFPCYYEIRKLAELIVCRNAYWKIAGEQMGLGKLWKPDWEKADERKYCIVNTEGNVAKWVQKTTNKILAFPTEEMRDAFYENFKDLIELVKELL